jgi:hypothetical protein
LGSDGLAELCKSTFLPYHFTDGRQEVNIRLSYILLHAPAQPTAPLRFGYAPQSPKSDIEFWLFTNYSLWYLGEVSRSDGGEGLATTPCFRLSLCAWVRDASKPLATL